MYKIIKIQVKTEHLNYYCCLTVLFKNNNNKFYTENK